MDYEVIKEAYKNNPELQLIDALDMLSRDPAAASEILDSVASQSNNEKKRRTTSPDGSHRFNFFSRYSMAFN